MDTIWDMIDSNQMNFSFAIQIFISGLWEFFTSVNRSNNYLYNYENDENTIEYLRKLDSIQNQLISSDNSINDLIYDLKNDISSKINKIKIINTKVSEDLSLLEYYINNYVSIN